MAVVRACEELRRKIVDKGAEYLNCCGETLEFDGKRVYQPDGELEICLKDIGNRVMCFNAKVLSAGYTHISGIPRLRSWWEWPRWKSIRRRETSG